MTDGERRAPSTRLVRTSRSLVKLAMVNVALGQSVEWVSKWAFSLSQLLSLRPKACDALVGWGLRPSTVRARAFAQQNGLPFIALEDGFLRSYCAGDCFPPLPLVVDELGIYYDRIRPSALEVLLAGDGDALAPMAWDLGRARGMVLEHVLSKYNPFHCEEQGNEEIHSYAVRVLACRGPLAVELKDDLCSDSTDRARRTSRRSVDEMFAASCFEYTR